MAIKTNSLLLSPSYIKMLEDSSAWTVDISWLEGKTIFIAGASGGIGSFLIDLLMRMDVQVKVLALGRNKSRLDARFSQYPRVSVLVEDITKSIPLVECDYIINAASNTHPVQYASYPVDTIMTNVLGTKNLLELASKQKKCRFIFMSSVEIYGQNKGDTHKFLEDYCGYIDCNTLRAGYPESKRAGEALCQAYAAEKGVDAAILRLSRVYGPTMANDDSKAIAQFIRNAVNKEDIILKSDGTPLYSYAFVYDAVSALLHTMIHGETGAAYNVSGDDSDISLKDLAKILAEIAGVKVVYHAPSSVEAKGFSAATKALLDTEKLKKIGWKSQYGLKAGLEQTIRILNEVSINDK